MLFIAVISNCQWKSIASIKNYILLLLLNFYKNVEPFSNRLSTLYLLRSCPDDITVMSKSLYPNDTISNSLESTFPDPSPNSLPYLFYSCALSKISICFFSLGHSRRSLKSKHLSIFLQPKKCVKIKKQAAPKRFS